MPSCVVISVPVPSQARLPRISINQISLSSWYTFPSSTHLSLKNSSNCLRLSSFSDFSFLFFKLSFPHRLVPFSLRGISHLELLRIFDAVTPTYHCRQQLSIICPLRFYSSFSFQFPTALVNWSLISLDLTRREVRHAVSLC